MHVVSNAAPVARAQMAARTGQNDASEDAGVTASDERLKAIWAGDVITATVSELSGAIADELAKVPFVDAVFCALDGGNDREAVYVVVPQHDDEAYAALMDAEERVRTRFPHREFDFRIRAHQGRRAVKAVPLGSEPLFVR